MRKEFPLLGLSAKRILFLIFSGLPDGDALAAKLSERTPQKSLRVEVENKP